VNAILVVDDDPRLREIVRRLLGHAGYDVSEAGSAEEAMDRLQARRFGLVLSDVHMPGRNGMALAAEIRSQFPATAVIMLTGDHDSSAVVASMRAGAIDYLMKPVTRDVLGRAVQRGLAWHRKESASRRTRQSLDRMLARRERQIARAVADLDAASATSVEALLRVLNLHDPDGHGHATRVAALSVDLARCLDVGAAALGPIRQASLLHDIGKVAIGEAVLRKPSALDGGEFDMVRQHPERGYEVLRHVPFLAEAAAIVRAHHEHFDGCGYARGLAGDDIPLGARIVALADSYDALTHDRPYRRAAGLEAAMHEIRRCSGRQFDPAVVDAFVHLRAAGRSAVCA
jgi:response regulator RpfG family c-di-GMP phosphodiesterase